MSRLLQLPQEVLNHIYAQCASSLDIEVVVGDLFNYLRIVDESHTNLPYGLIATNQRLRKEFLLFLAEKQTLHIAKASLLFQRNTIDLIAPLLYASNLRRMSIDTDLRTPLPLVLCQFHNLREVSFRLTRRENLGQLLPDDKQGHDKGYVKSDLDAECLTRVRNLTKVHAERLLRILRSPPPNQTCILTLQVQFGFFEATKTATKQVLRGLTLVASVQKERAKDWAETVVQYSKEFEEWDEMKKADANSIEWDGPFIGRNPFDI